MTIFIKAFKSAI